MILRHLLLRIKFFTELFVSGHDLLDLTCGVILIIGTAVLLFAN